jgi:hypothetical protein
MDLIQHRYHYPRQIQVHVLHATGTTLSFHRRSRRFSSMRALLIRVFPLRLGEFRRRCDYEADVRFLRRRLGDWRPWLRVRRAACGEGCRL